MTRRFSALFLSLVMAAAVAAGCGGAPAAPAQTRAATAETKPAPRQTTYPITLKDDAGRTVTIPAEPKRVVSVAPSNTELVFALGKQSVLVGRSDYDDYPADVKKIPSIGGFEPPNYEKIVGAQPDLLLLIGGSEEARNKLTGDYKLNVFVLDPKNFDDLYADIKNLGIILNAQSAAEQLVADMQKSVKEITDKVAKATTKPKVFYEVWNDPLMTAGAGTFINDLITMAGGENVGASVKGWGNFSPEQLAAANPDIYVAGSPDAAAKVKDRKDALSLKAVKDGKLFGVEDENLVVRPGPRLVLGLQWFAQTIHPELFK